MEITFLRKKEIKGEINGNFYFCSVIFLDEYHDFLLNVKCDENFIICESEIIINKAPYELCNVIKELVRKIIGIKIEKGFNKKITALIGGKEGCTHLVDILLEVGRCVMQLYLKKLILNNESEKLKEVLKETCKAY